MWFGKLSIIMWVFAIFVLFFGYYLNQFFNDPILANHTNANYAALQTIAASFHLDQSINSALVFGDFIAGVTVLFGLLSGNVITDVMTMGIPQFDVSMQLLFQVIWASSNVFLWIYIVANRSV